MWGLGYWYPLGLHLQPPGPLQDLPPTGHQSSLGAHSDGQEPRLQNPNADLKANESRADTTADVLVVSGHSQPLSRNPAGQEELVTPAGKGVGQRQVR